MGCLSGQLAAFHLIAIIDSYQFKCLSLVVHFFMALTTIGAAVVYLNKIEMSEELSDELDAVFLGEDESFTICGTEDGIECGQHGHNGSNGSRGSPKGFTNLGTRMNTGHTHTASILEGVYTAGVKANLEQGYNKGASSWSHSDIITYSGGKRAIVTFKNGKWRAK